MKKSKCKSWKVNLLITGIILAIAQALGPKAKLKKNNYSSSWNSNHSIKEEGKWPPRAHIRKCFGEKDNEWEKKL